MSDLKPSAGQKALEFLRGDNTKFVHSPNCAWYAEGATASACDCPVRVAKALLAEEK